MAIFLLSVQLKFETPWLNTGRHVAVLRNYLLLRIECWSIMKIISVVFSFNMILSLVSLHNLPTCVLKKPLVQNNNIMVEDQFKLKHFEKAFRKPPSAMSCNFPWNLLPLGLITLLYPLNQKLKPTYMAWWKNVQFKWPSFALSHFMITHGY